MSRRHLAGLALIAAIFTAVFAVAAGPVRAGNELRGCRCPDNALYR